MQQRKGPAERDAHIAYQAAIGLAIIGKGRGGPPRPTISQGPLRPPKFR
jgi:hypothetical protein